MVDNDCEFPVMPKTFEEFHITPNPFEVPPGKWKKQLTLRNHSDAAVLYKVKCSSNNRIQIFDCADILLPGNEISIDLVKVTEETAKDQILVLYCLVGKQWSTEEVSALNAWNRVKSRDISTRSTFIKIVENK